MPIRRFPSPRTADETDACLVVKDGSGNALAYVYFEEEPGRSSGEQSYDERRSPADRGKYRQAAGVAG